MSDPKNDANKSDAKKFLISDEDVAEEKAIKSGVQSEEEQYARDDRARREAEADLDVEMIDHLRGSSDNPVQPVRLTGKDTLCFSCHKGVSCWNECCHNTDITLTPMDILALSKHLNMRPKEFLTRFTLPSIWDKADLPIAKLRIADEGKDKKPCVFLDDETGCSVYEARPASCRYYPLGLAAVKMKGDEQRNDFFFLVKEPHCKGHEENVKQTVEEYRQSQGVELYDEVNRGWMDILMKMTSWKVMGGPHGKPLDQRTTQMFFMATTDVDAFRRFVLETKFLDTYEIDEKMVDQLKEDDGLVLQLALDWLKHIMFGEDSINLREPVLQKAIARARSDPSA